MNKAHASDSFFFFFGATILSPSPTDSYAFTGMWIYVALTLIVAARASAVPSLSTLSESTSFLPSPSPLPPTTSISVLTEPGPSVVPVTPYAFEPFPSPSSVPPISGVYPASSPKHPPPVESPALVPDFSQAWARAYHKAKTKVGIMNILRDSRASPCCVVVRVPYIMWPSKQPNRHMKAS